MKPTAIFSATLILIAGVTMAGDKIDTLCGTGHANEAVSVADVSGNPAGYYIRSMQVQLRHGDPRIVLAVGDEFHLCTRPAATPHMEATRALLLADERVVLYLFVPTAVRARAGS